MIFYLALELVALGFALTYAGRARMWGVLALMMLLVYGGVAVGLAAIPPHVRLPGVALFDRHWLIYPAIATCLALAATWIAFRRSAGEWDGSPRHGLAERTGFACLALTLLQLGLLVVLAAGSALVERDF